MARHFVAVCVVCLLCADHLPCKEHFEGVATGGSGQYRGSNGYLRSGPDLERFSRDVGGDRTPAMDDKGHDHMVQTHTRRKRHSVHLHEDHDEEATITTNENSRQYIKKIFDRFGDGDAKVMDLGGFEDMLQQLGLTKLLVREGRQLIGEEDPQGDENSCMNTYDFMTRISPNNARAQEPNTPKVAKRAVRSLRSIASSINDLTEGSKASSDGPAAGAHNSSVIFSNAATNNKTAEDRVINDSSGGQIDNLSLAPKPSIRSFPIDTESLFNICPILLHQLLTPNNISCLTASSITAPEPAYPVIEDDRTLVWVYATASVLGVSLCGLLGFAVIPCMEKSFYQTMLQFLVALAVGTLAGDALLHLLPHAMILSIETSAPEDVHKALTMKGLVAVLGVIAFFAIERGLTMIAEWRKERQKKQKLPERVRVMRDPESVSLNNSEKQCKHKYSSYPYCYDEIAMDAKEDHNHHSHHHPHGHEKKQPAGSVSTTSIGQVFKQNAVLPLAAKASLAEETNNLHFDHSQLNHHHHHHHHNHETGPAVVMTNNNGICSNKSQSKAERLNSTGSNNNNADNNTMSTNLEDSSSIESARMLKPVKAEESYTVILREHESKHHGHSHTHGHVHSPPGSLSAVAWMVIMGDGLHNFTDGMAIGAAFSNNIAGGFSTAIAVFCHELPHELGDFAVLLKAGMSVRKAVYYNILSSILSFFGMVLGVAIGDTPEASAWIFAVAAGLFIYIALVDMVPELTSSHHARCAGSNTLLQVLGMSMGLVAMLLIALNEEDLKSLFADHGHGHHNHHH